jgi:hypothetical protein
VGRSKVSSEEEVSEHKAPRDEAAYREQSWQQTNNLQTLLVNIIETTNQTDQIHPLIDNLYGQSIPFFHPVLLTLLSVAARSEIPGHITPYP